MAIRVGAGLPEKRDDRPEPSRWILLLLAFLSALVVGQGAGIVAATCGAEVPNTLSAGFIAFGSTLLTMLAVIGFLTER